MSKNKVEVIIGGQVYALQGNESQEHIQKVATLLDQKILEIQRTDHFRKLNTTQIQMMAALNLADEYIKLKEELRAFSDELEKSNLENIALIERVEEMGLEISKFKMNKRHK